MIVLAQPGSMKETAADLRHKNVSTCMQRGRSTICMIQDGPSTSFVRYIDVAHTTTRASCNPIVVAGPGHCGKLPRSVPEVTPHTLGPSVLQAAMFHTCLLYVHGPKPTHRVLSLPSQLMPVGCNVQQPWAHARLLGRQLIHKGRSLYKPDCKQRGK